MALPHRPPSERHISRIEARGVPLALRRKLRLYAAKHDIPMSAVIIAALEAYLEERK